MHGMIHTNYLQFVKIGISLSQITARPRERKYAVKKDFSAGFQKRDLKGKFGDCESRMCGLFMHNNSHTIVKSQIA